jgi:hypothetical protein
VIAIGEDTVLQFDGNAWELANPKTVPDVFSHEGPIDVWSASIGDMFVLGREIVVEYDGADWTELPAFPEGDPGDPDKTLRSVWGRTGSDVYAAGAQHGVLWYDGSDWASVGGDRFNALWGAAGDALFAVDTEIDYAYGGEFDSWPTDKWTVGMVFSYSGSVWSQTRSVTDTEFKSVWGSSETDLWIVGAATEFEAVDNGGPFPEFLGTYNPRVFRMNDGMWSGAYTPDSDGILNDIWGSSDTNIYAVGSEGLAVHFDGAGWTEMTSGAAVGLLAVWGSAESDVFAVGVDGTILCCDGQTWTAMESGTAETLFDIWGSSAGDVFAVGLNGTIVHYDGKVWRPMTTPTVNDLFGIWGSAADDIFAVGEYGTILHYEYR